MPIEATCQCGKRIKVKDELAGKRVKCPGCGQGVAIPKPAAKAPKATPVAEEDEFGLPAMPNLDFDEMGLSSGSDPLASAPMAKAMPAAGKARPAANLPSKGKSGGGGGGGGLPKGMIIAMGGFALLAVIVVVTVIIMGSGGDEVANAPAPAPAAGQPAPEAAPGPTTDANAAASATPATTTPAGEATTDPTAAAMVAASTPGQELPAPGAVETPIQPTPEMSTTAVAPAAVVAGPPTAAAMAAMQPAISKWHATPGAGMRSFPDKMRLLGYSWMVELLPHLEQQELYNKFDFKQSWSEPVNLQHGGVSISAFLNPGDSRTHWKGYPFENMGLTHYVGMSGVEDRRLEVAAELPRSDPRAGVFGYDAVARPEEITDGTSQTIMVIGSGNLTGPWVQGGGATIRGARQPYFDSITGFGSKGLAQEGAQVLFADGSVRAISADIDPKVFRAMCTIHGAETVDQQKTAFFSPDVIKVAVPAGPAPVTDSPEMSAPTTTEGSSNPNP